MVERAQRAGAEVVTAPGPQPWGYTGTFADPDGHLWMVTSATAWLGARRADRLRPTPGGG